MGRRRTAATATVAALATVLLPLGACTGDPEPQIAANALLGLWRVQFRGMAAYLDETRTSAEVQLAVTADVRRAANLIEAGLATFPTSAGM